MAVRTKVLIEPKEAGSSNAVQYTVEALQTVIDMFTVTNTSTSTENISVNLIDDGDSAGDDNLIIKEKAIFAGETVLLSGVIGHTLEKGSTISTNASTAGSLTIRASGREIS